MSTFEQPDENTKDLPRHAWDRQNKIAIKGAFGAGTDVGEDYLGEFLGLAGISWRPVANSPAIADAAPQHHLEHEGEGQENPLYEAQHTV